MLTSFFKKGLNRNCRAGESLPRSPLPRRLLSCMVWLERSGSLEIGIASLSVRSRAGRSTILFRSGSNLDVYTR